MEESWLEVEAQVRKAWPRESPEGAKLKKPGCWAHSGQAMKAMERSRPLLGVNQRPLQDPDLWVELAKGAWLVGRGGSAEKAEEVMVGSLWPVIGVLPVQRTGPGVKEQQVEGGWRVEREGARPSADPEPRQPEVWRLQVEWA